MPLLAPIGGQEDYEDTVLDSNPEKNQKNLRVEEKQELMSCHRRNQDNISWLFASMPGIDSQVACPRNKLKIKRMDQLMKT